VRYKGSNKYPLYLLFFVIFLILFVAQTYDSEKKELGSYSINNVDSSKIYLNILNISKLELTIENIFINNQFNICSTGDIFVYGTLRTSNEFVRIRIYDIKINNNLKILNKDESTNPLRTYEQFPVRVISTSNNCIGNKITLTFLEEVNIKYILIKNQKQSNDINLIKSYTITAYS
tara:strand:+ start:1089 stop:1616 length:528 start_codon:yes stop_codon:yes gene_type:complete